MNIPVDELEGNALDWAVAKASRVDVIIHNGRPGIAYGTGFNPLNYSNDWSLSGPIIDSIMSSYGLAIVGSADSLSQPDHVKVRFLDHRGKAFQGVGENVLVAVLRSHVKNKLGSRVEIPDELLQSPGKRHAP